MRYTNITRKNTRREAKDALKRSVCELLNWTEMQYAETVYHEGLAYLKAYIIKDDHAIAALERSPIFWAWWKNHWQNRDAAFLKHCQEREINFRDELYHALNNGAELAGSIYPNSVVLNESYALMITEVIQQETNHYEKAK